MTDNTVELRLTILHELDRSYLFTDGVVTDWVDKADVEHIEDVRHDGKAVVVVMNMITAVEKQFMRRVVK